MDAILNLVAAESHKITEGIIHEKFALTFTFYVDPSVLLHVLFTASTPLLVCLNIQLLIGHSLNK